MRVNPFSLPRARHAPKSGTFTDPLHPDKPVTIGFRYLDAPGSYKALERGQELVRTYIEDDDDESIPFPAVDGEGVELTERLLFDVAAMEFAQVAESDYERYSAEDLIAFSVTMPTAFEKMMALYTEVQRQGRTSEKNGPGATA